MDGSQKKKTDHHHLAAKLLLRRHFLHRYHGGGEFSVLDCCEGRGEIWDELERDYPCWRWGLDIKPEQGRLVLDSRVVLASGVDYDVVDIDTYGSPWEHWCNLIAHVRQPVTVFLTYCLVMRGGGGIQDCVRQGLGLEFGALELPQVVASKLYPVIPLRMIALARDEGLKVIEIKEAVYGKRTPARARYFGVRLEP
jgi:hypothetical protein